MSPAPGRSSIASWGIALVVLSALLVSAPASAQSATAQARTLFAEGRKLMQKERYAEACPKFEESLRLDDGIGTQFNLAHCWEKIGRTASAWGLFLDVAAAANQAKQKKREVAARDRARALEPKLSRLRIQVSNPPVDMTVSQSGEEVGRAAWDTEMPIDPGPHLIEAKAPGKHDWSQEVNIETPGETTTVSIPELEDREVAKAAAPVEAPREEAMPVAPEMDRGGGLSTGRVVTTVVLATVGVAGIATGVIFGLKANADTAAAKELCVGGESGTICNRDSAVVPFDMGVQEQAELEQHRSDAKQEALIGYIGFGVGAAALISSAVILFTAPTGEEPGETSHLDISPTFGRDVMGATLSGTF